MILEADSGWWFLTEHKSYGPYTSREKAEYCREWYEAMVGTAPGCHHPKE